MKLQEKFMKVEETLNGYFVERADEIHGLNVAAIGGLNILLLGSPGVAKSLLVKSWTQCIEDSTIFEWLLTKYSTPDELYGPLSIKALKESDKHIRNTKDKLPEAHIAFTDEIFKANSAILNSLLTAMNERVFYNDGPKKIPLIMLIGASNEIPESEDGLDALYDRFVLKYMVKPIQEMGNRMTMLGSGKFTANPIITLKDLEKARQEASQIPLNEEAAYIYNKIMVNLGTSGLAATDRTYKLSIQALQANAWLRGSDKIETVDFEILKDVLWKDPNHYKDIYHKLLEIANPLKKELMSYLENVREAYDKINAETDEQEKIRKATNQLKTFKDVKKKIKDKIKDAPNDAVTQDMIKKVIGEIEGMTQSLIYYVIDPIPIGKDNK